MDRPQLRPLGMHLVNVFTTTDIGDSRYLQAQRPSTTITYTFIPNTDVPNSMTLTPPSYVEGPHAPYWICVNMNCFTPSSYITTVRRGTSDGEIVGDFECVKMIFLSFIDWITGRLGISAMKKPSVCMRGNEYPLSDVIESKNHKLFRNVRSSCCCRILRLHAS